MPLTTPSTAWSIGASSKTMFAALPPSSSVSFLRVPATARAICRPTSVEPVNATLSTPGCPTTAAPVAPAPGRMLTTPGGRSACWQISAKSIAVSGVVSAGLSTTVLPVASAGATFHASISSGKFQGMTWPATPSGCGSAAEPRVLELVGPARVVEEVRRRQRHVDVAALADRLAVVEASRGRRARGRAPAGSARSGRGTWRARRRGIGPQTLLERGAGGPRRRGRRPAPWPRATLASTSSVAGLSVSSEPPSTGSANSPSTKRP